MDEGIQEAQQLIESTVPELAAWLKCCDKWNIPRQRTHFAVPLVQEVPAFVDVIEPNWQDMTEVARHTTDKLMQRLEEDSEEPEVQLQETGQCEVDLKQLE